MIYGFTRAHVLHYSLSACTYEYQLTRQKFVPRRKQMLGCILIKISRCEKKGLHGRLPTLLFQSWHTWAGWSCSAPLPWSTHINPKPEEEATMYLCPRSRGSRVSPQWEHEQPRWLQCPKLAISGFSAALHSCRSNSSSLQNAQGKLQVITLKGLTPAFKQIQMHMIHLQLDSLKQPPWAVLVYKNVGSDNLSIKRFLLSTDMAYKE